MRRIHKVNVKSDTQIPYVRTHRHISRELHLLVVIVVVVAASPAPTAVADWVWVDDECNLRPLPWPPSSQPSPSQYFSTDWAYLNISRHTDTNAHRHLSTWRAWACGVWGPVLLWLRVHLGPAPISPTPPHWHCLCHPAVLAIGPWTLHNKHKLRVRVRISQGKGLARLAWGGCKDSSCLEV